MRFGTYSAWRIAGADAGALEPVFLDWLREVGEDAETSATIIGGTEVTAITFGSTGASYLYASLGTPYLISLPEELATPVIEQLPWPVW